MRALIRLCSGLFIGLASSGALAALPDGCGPVADPQRIAQSARIVLIGEMHGTREYPSLVARLACAALDHGRALTLAFEMPLEEEARLEAYLASDGGPAARSALTAGSRFWHEVRDGRSSGAMLLLIEQARRWREQGKQVRAIALVGPGDYDGHMAARIRQAAAAAPDRLLLALTGQMHNRMTPPNMRGRHGPVPTPMGALLRDLDPVSIGNENPRGAFFGCMPDCRVHDSPDAGMPLAVPVIRPAPGRGPYTHIVELGTTSASPPAADILL